MTLSSYSDVFGITHEQPFDPEIRTGDIVAMGQNHFPHFEVVAISGDKAWVRNVVNGADHLAFVNRCRRLSSAFEALPLAAE